MTDPVTIAAAALTASAVTANVQYQASQRAAEAQQAAQQTQRRRQNIQALREAQMKRAVLQQQSANSGTLGSSGFGGGMSSLQSQLGSNIGFGNRMTTLGQEYMAAQQTANRAEFIGGLVQSGLNFASGMQQKPSNQYSSQDIQNASMNDLYAPPGSMIG